MIDETTDISNESNPCSKGWDILAASVGNEKKILRTYENSHSNNVTVNLIMSDDSPQQFSLLSEILKEIFNWHFAHSFG